MRRRWWYLALIIVWMASAGPAAAAEPAVAPEGTPPSAAQSTSPSAAPKAAAGPTKVAVMALSAPGFDKAVVVNLYGILVAEIDADERYRVVARDEIEALLGFEQQKTLLGCDDTSCLAEIAGALGVEKVISGKVGKVGQTFVINLTMIDHSTARVEKRLIETVRGEEDLLIEAIAEVGRKLIDRKTTAEPAVAQTVADPAAETDAQGSTAAATAGAEPGEGSFPILPVVVLAAGGVGVLAGAGLLGLSAAEYASYQASTDGQEARDLHQRVQLEQIGGGATGALGLAAITAGAVLLLISE
jgi:hypothetical protein